MNTPNNTEKRNGKLPEANEPLQLPALPSLDKQAVTHIHVSNVVPSPFQPRKEFPAEEMADLTESIRANGIRIPLLGRLKPKGKPGEIELVAGERRFRCAATLKLATVPMIVQPLTDDEVIRIQRLENGARENLKALEAAEDYLLLEKQGKSVEEICTLYGVKRSHVFTRKRVARLPDDIKKLIREGKLAITVADLIAKLPLPEMQAQAAKEFGKGISEWDGENHVPQPYPFRRAQTYIAEHFQCDLDHAPFDVNKIYSGDVKRKGSTLMLASRGGCGECPHRSGNCKELFPEIKSAHICTEPDCYAGKMQAHTDEKLKEAKAKGLQTLSAATSAKLFPSYSRGRQPVYGSGYIVPEQTCDDDDKNRTYAQLLKKAKTAPQTFVALDNQGVAREVMKLNDVNEALKKAGYKFVETDSDRERSTARDRADATERKAEREQCEKVIAAVLPQIRAKAEKLAGTEAGQLKLLTWLFTELDEWFYNTTTTEKVGKQKLPQAWALAATLICEEQSGSDYYGYPTCIKDVCDLLGLDLKAEEKKLKESAKVEPTKPAAKATTKKGKSK